MIEAFKNGKLGKILDKEDLLTSTVFGLMKYDEENKLIRLFFEQARDKSGNRLKLPDFDEIEYYFWPRFKDINNNDKEPDLVLILRNDSDHKKDFLILVEVKNWSGAGENQLSTYYESLRNFSLKRYYNYENISGFGDNRRCMVYLTRFDYEEDIKNVGDDDTSIPVYGLRWIKLKEICCVEEDCNDCVLCLLKRDLNDFLSCFSFKMFEGWKDIETDIDFEEIGCLLSIFYCDD